MIAKKLKVAAALALIGVVLAGCNTVAGMGKDMQRAGESVQGAAKK